MPSRNTYHLTWVSLILMWGISSRLLQQSTAAAPYLGQGYPSYLECGVYPLSPPVPAQLQLLGHGVAPLGCRPDIGHKNLHLGSLNIFQNC